MSVKQHSVPRAYRERINRPEQILAAACRAICERGFASTRIVDVAREAGVSTGTVHYYFEVRDEVLMGALVWASERLFGRLEELAAGAGSETERLAQLLEISVPAPGERRGEYVLWIELWVRALHEPGLRARCEALSRRWRGYFFDAVRRGTEAGEFRPVAGADEVAERLSALADGLGFELLMRYGWTSAERMRGRLHAFAAEQLEVPREALARGSVATASALDGTGR
jgi:AcrR family transcriptional regulator